MNGEGSTIRAIFRGGLRANGGASSGDCQSSVVLLLEVETNDLGWKAKQVAARRTIERIEKHVDTFIVNLI